MEGDRTSHIGQYIFPIITEEWENADMAVPDSVQAPYLQADSVTELSDGSKLGKWSCMKQGNVETLKRWLLTDIRHSVI